MFLLNMFLFCYKKYIIQCMYKCGCSLAAIVSNAHAWNASNLFILIANFRTWLANQVIIKVQLPFFVHSNNLASDVSLAKVNQLTLCFNWKPSKLFFTQFECSTTLKTFQIVIFHRIRCAILFQRQFESNLYNSFIYTTCVWIRLWLSNYWIVLHIRCLFGFSVE